MALQALLATHQEQAGEAAASLRPKYLGLERFSWGGQRIRCWGRKTGNPPFNDNKNTDLRDKTWTFQNLNSFRKEYSTTFLSEALSLLPQFTQPAFSGIICSPPRPLYMPVPCGFLFSSNPRDLGTIPDLSPGSNLNSLFCLQR